VLPVTTSAAIAVTVDEGHICRHRVDIDATAKHVHGRIDIRLKQTLRIRNSIPAAPQAGSLTVQCLPGG
jgi:hypothetical protein